MKTRSSIELIAIYGLIGVTVFELVGNVVSIQTKGIPNRTWLLDLMAKLYSTELTFYLFSGTFLAVSAISLVLTASGILKTKGTASRDTEKGITNAHNFAHHTRNFHEMIWVTSVGMLTSIVAISLYLIVVNQFPGGDAVAYVGYLVQFQELGLGALASVNRPLVGITLLIISSLVNSTFPQSILNILASFVGLCSFIYGVFAYLCVRKVGLAPLESGICVLLGYVTWVFQFSGDNYANFLAFSMAFGFEYFFVDALDGETVAGAIGGVILSLIFLAHEQTGFFILVSSIVTVFIVVLHKRSAIHLESIFAVFISSSLLLSPFLLLAATDANYFGVFSAWLGPVTARYGEFSTLQSQLNQATTFGSYGILHSKATLVGFPQLIGQITLWLGIVFLAKKWRLTTAGIVFQSWTGILLIAITAGTIPLLLGIPSQLSLYVSRFFMIMPVPLLLAAMLPAPKHENDNLV